jgi:hypothetical protein
MFDRVAATVVAIGLISSVVFAILYFMQLPIFGVVSLSWMFVAALVALAVGVAALIMRQVWHRNSDGRYSNGLTD